MKEDNLRKLKNIIEENLNFNIVIKKFGKPKKAFLAYLERALMYMRMYGKYRLAIMEKDQFDNILSSYNDENMKMFMMDYSEKIGKTSNYDPKDIDYLRTLNVYSHSERRVRANLTKEIIKKTSPSYLLGLYNRSVEGCGEEDRDIWKLFWIDDIFLDDGIGINEEEYCDGYYSDNII